MAGKNGLVYKYAHQLAKRPTTIQIANAAKGAILRRAVKKATKQDVDIIDDHAKDYFNTHPSVDQLLYEVYISPDGNIKMSSRKIDEEPPDGIVIASCLKYRIHVARHMRQAYDCIGSRWMYEPGLARNLSKLRQLGLDV